MGGNAARGSGCRTGKLGHASLSSTAPVQPNQPTVPPGPRLQTALGARSATRPPSGSLRSCTPVAHTVSRPGVLWLGRCSTLLRKRVVLWHSVPGPPPPTAARSRTEYTPSEAEMGGATTDPFRRACPCPATHGQHVTQQAAAGAGRRRHRQGGLARRAAAPDGRASALQPDACPPLATQVPAPSVPRALALPTAVTQGIPPTWAGCATNPAVSGL